MKTNRIAAASSIVIAATLLIAPSLVAGEIHKRSENQQDRIAQGIKSGALTPRETARLETKEAGLQARTADMREDNGGHLTARERARVDRAQNRLSKDIYKQKHDRQKQ